MKRFITCLALVMLLTASSVWADRAQYVPDIVVTESDAIWSDIRAYPTTGSGQLFNAIAALNAVPGGGTLLISESLELTTSIATDSDVVMKFTPGAIITVDNNGIVLTIGGNIEADPNQQIFIVGNTYGSIIAGANSGVSVVYPEWWGAVGDAVNEVAPSTNGATGTDDSAAMQNALDFYPDTTYLRGGVIQLGARKRYLIDSDLDIYASCVLKGHHESAFGRVPVRLGGSTIVLDSTNANNNTINLHEWASIDGVIIVNGNLEYLNWPSYAITGPAWEGVGITLSENGSFSGEGQSITNSMIVGFAYGISHTYSVNNGFMFSGLYLDNINDIYIEGSNNPIYISNISIYPWGTGTGGGDADDSYRSGRGIYLDDCDVAYIDNILIFGKRYGIEVRGNEGASWGINLNNIYIEGAGTLVGFAPGEDNVGVKVGHTGGESVAILATNVSVQLESNAATNYGWFFDTSEICTVISCTSIRNTYGMWAAATTTRPTFVQCIFVLSDTADYYYGGVYSFSTTTGEYNDLSDINLAGNLSVSTDAITATSAGVAASVATITTFVTTNGDSDLDNVTLAAGSRIGQIKIIICVSEVAGGDTWKITPANMLNGTRITFTGVEQGCMLIWTGSGWTTISVNGGIIS